MSRGKGRKGKRAGKATGKKGGNFGLNSFPSRGWPTTRKSGRQGLNPKGPWVKKPLESRVDEELLNWDFNQFFTENPDGTVETDSAAISKLVDRMMEELGEELTGAILIKKAVGSLSTEAKTELMGNIKRCDSGTMSDEDRMLYELLGKELEDKEGHQLDLTPAFADRINFAGNLGGTELADALEHDRDERDERLGLRRIVTSDLAYLPTAFWRQLRDCEDFSIKDFRLPTEMSKRGLLEAGLDTEKMMGEMASLTLGLAVMQRFKKSGERFVGVTKELQEQFEQTDALEHLTGSDLKEVYPTFGLWLARPLKRKGTDRGPVVMLVNFVGDRVGERCEIDFNLREGVKALDFGTLLSTDEDKGIEPITRENYVGALAIAAIYPQAPHLPPETDTSILPLYKGATLLETFAKTSYMRDERFGATEGRLKELYHGKIEPKDNDEREILGFLHNLDFAVNAIATMASYPEYIFQKEVGVKTPHLRGSKKNPKRRYKTSKLSIACLKQVVTSRLPGALPERVGAGGGGMKSTHWRRGHWRRQPHGPGWERANAERDKPQEAIDLGGGRPGHMAWLQPVLIKGGEE